MTWWQQHTELKMIQVIHLSNPTFDQMALKIKCTSIAQYSQQTEWIRGRHMNLINILMGTKCFGTCTSSNQMYYTSIYLFFTIFKKNKSVYFFWFPENNCKQIPCKTDWFHAKICIILMNSMVFFNCTLKYVVYQCFNLLLFVIECESMFSIFMASDLS